jgi:hypothetical protein
MCGLCRDRGIIHNSIGRPFPRRFVKPGLDIRTCPSWVDFGMRGRTLLTWAGAIPRSEGTPITCGHPEFQVGLDTLMTAGEREPIVVMCAEAVPWRCHRSLIADALSIRGIPVEHILSATRTQPHALTPFAQVHGMRITYPRDHLEASSPGVSAVSVAASQRRTPTRKGTKRRKGGRKPARP